MKNLAFTSLLLVACTSPSPPKEAPREAAPAPTTSMTVEPASTVAAGGAASGASPAASVRCGEATCPPTQVCCNESCGICTPPGGACVQMICEPKPDASGAAPTTGPTTEAACATDADCRTYSSYCPEMPCGCLALASSAADPRCTRPAVNCFVDPCRKKIARCKAGACVLASSP